jgi:hypothetical protein
MSKKIKIPSGNHNFAKVEAERVLCNDIILPWESNPGKVRLKLVISTYGPLGAVWASDDGEALDILVDADLAGAILIDKDAFEKMDPAERDYVHYAGNAGEPVDLTNVVIEDVNFQLDRDCALLCSFAEARGKTCDTLADL